MLSGKIHKNGIGARFSVRWLVTATSSALGHSASVSQSAYVPRLARAAMGSSSAAVRWCLCAESASTQHSSANTAYALD